MEKLLGAVAVRPHLPYYYQLISDAIVQHLVLVNIQSQFNVVTKTHVCPNRKDIRKKRLGWNRALYHPTHMLLETLVSALP